MKKMCLRMMIAILIMGCGNLIAYAQTNDLPDSKEIREIQTENLRIRLPFVQNNGQFGDDNIKFMADTIAGKVYVTDRSINYGIDDGSRRLMIRESFETDESRECVDPTRGMRLVVLSVATSIDALAVGFSLAALNVSIVLPVIIIGVVALVFTYVGLILGNRVLSSGKLGKKAELLGGVVLVGIGIKILFEHGVFDFLV